MCHGFCGLGFLVSILLTVKISTRPRIFSSGPDSGITGGDIKPYGTMFQEVSGIEASFAEDPGAHCLLEPSQVYLVYQTLFFFLI